MRNKLLKLQLLLFLADIYFFKASMTTSEKRSFLTFYCTDFEQANARTVFMRVFLVISVSLMPQPARWFLLAKHMKHIPCNFLLVAKLEITSNLPTNTHGVYKSKGVYPIVKNTSLGRKTLLLKVVLVRAHLVFVLKINFVNC